MGGELNDIGVGNDSLNVTWKSQATNGKRGTLNYIKIKNIQDKREKATRGMGETMEIIYLIVVNIWIP